MSILIFLVILSLLVFVHELGHFLVAKKSGMNVEEFGFGFPPRAIGFQKRNGRWKVVWGPREVADKQTTVYSINFIPAGGFVKITGENNDENDNKNSFVNKRFLPRFFTLTAGVIMNVLLAFVLYTVSFMYGAPVMVSELSDFGSEHVERPSVIVASVASGSPAEEAKLEPGDEIVSIDGNEISDSPQVSSYVKANAGKTFDIAIRRAGEVKSYALHSLQNPPEGRGPTGISLALVGTVKYGAVEAVTTGARATYVGFFSLPTGLYEVFKSGDGVKALGGPVRIYQETDKVQKQSGAKGLLPFTAFLSLNLAFLNILPIPALDGGRVLFLLIEKVRGKKNRKTVEQAAHAIGMLVLLFFLLVISLKDIFFR